MDLDPDLLISRYEIAARYSVPKKTVNRWISRREATLFPEPFALLGRVELYEIARVEAWITLWRRTHVGRKGLGGLR